MDLLVSHAGLDRTAEDLSMVVDRIGGRLHALELDLAPLRHEWLGDAQQAYTAAKLRWDAAIGEMRSLLREVSAQVVRANDDYRAADARGARAFGG